MAPLMIGSITEQTRLQLRCCNIVIAALSETGLLYEGLVNEKRTGYNRLWKIIPLFVHHQCDINVIVKSILPPKLTKIPIRISHILPYHPGQDTTYPTYSFRCLCTNNVI